MNEYKNEHFSLFKEFGSKNFKKVGDKIVDILEQLPCYFRAEILKLDSRKISWVSKGFYTES